MKNSCISEAGRKPLSSQERERFEGYMAEIFSRLGMDLDNEPCRRTPHRWVQALVDMTDGYNGDPNIEVVFKRECVNCAQDIPTVQIVEGPIEFTSLCEQVGRSFLRIFLWPRNPVSRKRRPREGNAGYAEGSPSRAPFAGAVGTPDADFRNAPI
jgi:hypothetical protein